MTARRSPSPSPPTTSSPRTAASPAAGGRRATRWGDREGRRRDILDAARDQIAARGYLGLNMRDVASRAGVSAGTLYSYFATKEEIFATLYAEAVEAYSARIAPLCDTAPDLETFLVELTTSYLDIHGTYGRHFSLWAALAAEGADGEPRDGPLPADLTRALRRATIRQGELVAGALRRLVPGSPTPDERRQRLAFLWCVQNGLADHLHSERHLLSRVEAGDLIAFACRTMAVGLGARPPG
ncbi:MAG TPA: helix-turn-helix domain-containing protein [Acidimicrobiales bacterium]